MKVVFFFFYPSLLLYIPKNIVKKSESSSNEWQVFRAFLKDKKRVGDCDCCGSRDPAFTPELPFCVSQVACVSCLAGGSSLTGITTPRSRLSASACRRTSPWSFWRRPSSTRVICAPSGRGESSWEWTLRARLCLWRTTFSWGTAESVSPKASWATGAGLTSRDSRLWGWRA